MAVDPVVTDDGREPAVADVVYLLSLRYDEDTLLWAPVAVEMLLPAEMPEPLVLRTAVMLETAVFLVGMLPLPVLVRTLADADDDDPLLVDEVLDSEADELFLDV